MPNAISDHQAPYGLNAHALGTLEDRAYGPDWSRAAISPAQTRVAMAMAKLPLRVYANSFSFDNTIIETMDGDAVAQISARDDSSYGAKELLAEMWGRAYLLAAAPELLAVLRRFEGSAVMLPEDHAEALSTARDVIAKATGTKPESVYPDWRGAELSTTQVAQAFKRAREELRVCASTPSFVETMDGDIVAQTVERIDGLADSKARTAEIWARALVLAAAPQLLAAVCTFVELARNSAATAEDFSAARNAAGAAIDKAIGF